MRTPEGYEKKEIRDYLSSIGAWHFSPFMTGYGRSGVPDLVACVDGYFWAIEVKRIHKEPTVQQRLRMKEIGLCHGLVAWGTADKVIAEIEAWRNQKRASRLDRMVF